MDNKKLLVRGTSKCARFFVCETTEIVKEAKIIHKLDPIETMIFGKFINSMIILSVYINIQIGVLVLLLIMHGITTTNMYSLIK